MVRLSVPASLAFRSLLLRVIGSCCKLVGTDTKEPVQAVGQGGAHDADTFESQVVSACSEAFNNLVLHGHGDGPRDARIDVEVDISPDGVTVRLIDWGTTFDPTVGDNERPAERLPESNMGIYIMRSFMDEVAYRAGCPPNRPNVLSLTKRRTVP